MRTPVVIIGAQRSGTTRLYRSLDAHPQMVGAKPVRPEPKYFLGPAAIVGDPAGWAAACFDGPDAIGDRVPFEKSTSYLEHPSVAGAIAATFDRVEVVVLLRDPVARALSNYRFSVANGIEHRSVAEALLGPSPAWDRRRFSVDPRDYLGRSRYCEHLEPWQRTFGKALHVLVSEEFLGVRQRLRDLYRVLGVDPHFLPADWDARINRAAVDVTVDAAVLWELRDRLAPSVRRLEDQLGRSLDVWSWAGRD